MIRELTLEEVKTAAEIAPLFYEEGKFPGGFKPEVFTASWQSLIKQKMGYIFGLFHNSFLVGGLGMIVHKDLNDGELVAAEAFWFVHPDHRGEGVKLLFHARKVAKDLSCKRMGMIHLLNPAGEKLSHIFTRLGFKPVETHYMVTL